MRKSFLLLLIALLLWGTAFGKSEEWIVAEGTKGKVEAADRAFERGQYKRAADLYGELAFTYLDRGIKLERASALLEKVTKQWADTLKVYESVIAYQSVKIQRYENEIDGQRQAMVRAIYDHNRANKAYRWGVFALAVLSCALGAIWRWDRRRNREKSFEEKERTP